MLGLRGRWLVLHYPISGEVGFFALMLGQIEGNSHGLSGTIVELRPLQELFNLFVFLFDLNLRICRWDLANKADPRCLEHFSRQHFQGAK